MSSTGNPSPIEEREVREQLDALDARRETVAAAAHLARLGAWARRSALPRGTLWLPAANALPDPDRIRTLVSVLREGPEPEAQAQAAAALGEWGGAESVAPLHEMLAASANAEIREHCIHALGTIGGPQATRILLAVLVQTKQASDALSILDALEELLVGGIPDPTDAALVVPAPPAHLASELETTLDEIRAALDRFAASATSDAQLDEALDTARSRAGDLVGLIDRRHEPADSAALSADERAALLARMDRIPAMRAGACLSEEEIADYANGDLDEPAQTRADAHVESCSTCLEIVERTLESRSVWEGAADERLKALRARIALQEAAALLSSAPIEATTNVALEGANAAVSIQAQPRGPRIRVAMAFRTRQALEVDWRNLGTLVVGAKGTFASPWLDADGRAEFELDPALAPFHVLASPHSVALGVQPSAGSYAPRGAETAAPPPVSVSDASVTVTVEHLEDGIVDVRVETRNESLRNGFARLEFRQPNGEPLVFTSPDGEAVPMTIPLDLREEDRFFGQWMAQVTIPEGTTLHVAVFPPHGQQPEPRS